MGAPSLTFTELERRVAAIPDGPSASLNTPTVLVWLNAIGTLGAVIGLLPSIFIRFVEPQQWMVWMAQAGLFTEIVFFAPSFFRAIWLLAREIGKWRHKMVEQLDHDAEHFRALTRWLIGFPKTQLMEQLRFVDSAQQRLSSKLGLLVGSVEKLGVVPVVAALTISLRNLGDLTAIPVWQAILAVFLVVMWMLAWIAALMRLRMQLYVSLLSGAIEQKGG